MDQIEENPIYKKGLEKLAFIKRIPQHPQKSNEWLEQRKKKLTSSDAATALGLNPYQKPIELLFSKNNAGKPFIGNTSTLFGQKYETEAANLYEALMGKINYEYGLISFDSIKEIRRETPLTRWLREHPEIKTDWCAGSPDGIAIDKRGLEDLIMVEIKCPMRRKIEFGKVPEHYMPQVQLNMAILDLDKADFIEYGPINTVANQTHRPIINIVRVHIDYEWLFSALIKINEFWSEVLYWSEKGIINHPEYNKYAYVSGLSVKKSLKDVKDLQDIENGLVKKIRTKKSSASSGSSDEENKTNKTKVTFDMFRS